MIINDSYRFTAKLRTYGDLLAACRDRVTAALHAQHPGMETNLAIDGSDLPAYANGQRDRAGARAYSDPGRVMGAPLRRLHPKGGGYYG